MQESCIYLHLGWPAYGEHQVCVELMQVSAGSMQHAGWFDGRLRASRGHFGHLALKLRQDADVLPLHHAVGPAVPVHAGRKVQAGHHLVRGVDVVHAVPRRQHMARPNQRPGALQRPAEPCERCEACCSAPCLLTPQWLTPMLNRFLCMWAHYLCCQGGVHSGIFLCTPQSS